jgi:hypothetical protein
MLAGRFGLPTERHHPAVTRKKSKVAVNELGIESWQMTH